MVWVERHGEMFIAFNPFLHQAIKILSKTVTSVSTMVRKQEAQWWLKGQSAWLNFYKKDAGKIGSSES